MAGLKHTSPTAEPTAPTPKPSITSPLARTRTPVGTRSRHPEGVSWSGRSFERVALGMRLWLSAARVARQAKRVETPRNPMADTAPLRDTVSIQIIEAMKRKDKVRVEL